LPGEGRVMVTTDMAGRNSTTEIPGSVPPSRVGNRHCLPRAKLPPLINGVRARRQMDGRWSTKLESL